MSRPLRSQPTRDRIVVSARALFAELGYERTTVRAVADAAGIHSSLVMRYFGTKEGLFATAATFDLGLPDLSAVSPSDIGPALVRHALSRWGREGGGDLPSLLRSAVTHEAARARMLAIFREQLEPAVARLCPVAHVPVATALIATQMLGLALTRYVLRLPPVLALDDAVLVERIGGAIQRYLSPGGEAT